jgi:hypothetical protein
MSSRRQALLIGSGRRIKNNFLPAVAQLGDRIEVVGLWSPTPAHAQQAAAPWGLPVAPSLAAGLTRADTVMVSVSTLAVPSVLQQLLADAERLTLVLDTPVFGSLAHLPAMRWLRRFPRVVVAEDYMNYPQWELARDCVAAGLIGQVERVELRHSGYRYHGLALIRSFFGFPLATRVRKRRIVDGTQVDYVFAGGGAGRIIEPYDQARGATVISGTHGLISDDLTVEDGRRVFYINTAPDQQGFSLGERHLELPKIAALMQGEDSTWFNACKSCGLMRVLESIWEDNINVRYDYRQALYDHVTTAAMSKLPVVVDPLAMRQRSYIDLADRAFNPRQVS